MTDGPPLPVDEPPPAVTVRISQREVRAGRRLPVGLLRRAARLAVGAAGCRDPVEISLTLLGDERMRELNRSWRGVDSATDVLAFPLEEAGSPQPAGAPRLLGDVIVSLDTAERQAAEAGCPMRREVAWLVSHGVLHLLGFDHATQSERAEMRAREERVLASLERTGALG